jgi:Transcriptional regulator, AbiEi antitoxin, Type IV TA system
MTRTVNQTDMLAQARAVLERIPDARVRAVRRPKGKAQADGVLSLERDGQTYTLILEAKSSAEPRHVRTSILQLRELLRESDAFGVFIAPWISPESRRLLEDAGMGYIDLQGNVRLAFGPVFIERLGAPAPQSVRRELRSLWKPASARVLRALLREPRRDWNLLQLAQVASVSHAQAHKVKTALLGRDWIAEQGKARFKTVRLTRPDALLEAWRAGYEPLGQRTAWYAMLERNEIERALETLGQVAPDARVALASFSAARHLAPYARVPSEFFYANRDGLNALRDVLELKPVDTGENIVVFLEPDEGVFLDAQDAAGFTVTSPVQTYLDLSLAGNRGTEAAAHLLETRIRPTWEAS